MITVLAIVSVVASVTIAISGSVVATASSLVGYWNFDETGGSSLSDASGTGNNGMLYGGVTRSSVLPPTSCFANTSSLNFNGSNSSYVDIPDDQSMDPSSQITIAFWMNARSLSSSDYTHLVFKRQGSITSYGVWVNPAGNIYMETNDNTVHGLSGTSVLGVNTWHYIVATYDGTTQKLFVDGTMEDSAHLPGITLGYQNEPLELGRGAWNLPFDGYLDDLRIYNRGLTDQEIADLAAGGCGPGVAPVDDGDGVSKTTEDAAPNSGDANNDGTGDSAQANVSSFVDSVTGKYTTIALDSACSLTRVSSVAAVAQGHQDKGYVYSTGLADFSANCGTAGYTTTATVYFYGAPTGQIVRKYNPTTGGYSTISDATQSSQTIGGQSALVASYRLTDGGVLDADGIANGTILDPVGLATPAAVSAATGVPGAPNTGVGRMEPASSAAASIIVPLITATLLVAGGFAMVFWARAHRR